MVIAQAVREGSVLSTSDISRVNRCIEVRDTQVNGCLIRWRILGKGAPLVLLHGGHGSWLHWLQNIESLAREYRVYVPDMPGFNDSSELLDTTEPGLAGLSQALREGLAGLIEPTQKINLAGFSFGGLVAAKLTTELSAVSRLVLLGPAGHGLPRRQTEDLVNWRKQPDVTSKRMALRQNLGSFMLHSHLAISPLALEIHEQSCMNTRFNSKAISRAGNLPELLGQIDVPVFMLWGQHDVTAHPEQVAEALQQGRTNRDWCLISDAGHWVQFERAQEVSERMLYWLRTN
jgi:2-hydroxy-6-oxonona-2,4-dienedioate hydrolase